MSGEWSRPDLCDIIRVLFGPLKYDVLRGMNLGVGPTTQIRGFFTIKRFSYSVDKRSNPGSAVYRGVAKYDRQNYRRKIIKTIFDL